MWICWKLPHGKKVCHWIPIYYEIPKFPRFPEPGPYDELIIDATILATINEATKHVADKGLRQSLEGGVAAALKSMQARAGEEVSVSLEAPRHG
jgi:hypothetical protein